MGVRTSFHLELLAVEILGVEPIESFSVGLAKFFSEAEDYLQEACLIDPANSENLIDVYLDEDGVRDDFLELLIFAQISKLHNPHQGRRLGSISVCVACVSSLFE